MQADAPQAEPAAKIKKLATTAISREINRFVASYQTTARQLDVVADAEFFHQVSAVNVHDFLGDKPSSAAISFHRHHPTGEFFCHLTLTPGKRILTSGRQLEAISGVR